MPADALVTLQASAGMLSAPKAGIFFHPFAAFHHIQTPPWLYTIIFVDTYILLQFTWKISTTRASIQNMGQQISTLDKSNGQSIWHESEGWGFESPSGQDIFCLKNFDTFTRTPVCVKHECCCPCTVDIPNVEFTSKIKSLYTKCHLTVLDFQKTAQSLIKDRNQEHFPWSWPQVNATRPHWWLVIIGSGMARCPQTTSHYLSPCWPQPLSPSWCHKPQLVRISLTS